jgi:hypothetical protein
MHLIQPWEKIELDHPFLGAFFVAFQIFWGKRNPLYYQMQRLRARLIRDFGEKLDREPLILIGDLNVTRKSQAFRLLCAGFEPAFSREVATFPSLDAVITRGYPRMQIDHALVAGGLRVEAAAVLPWKGSDHYPIAVRLISDAENSVCKAVRSRSVFTERVEV